MLFILINYLLLLLELLLDLEIMNLLLLLIM